MSHVSLVNTVQLVMGIVRTSVGFELFQTLLSLHIYPMIEKKWSTKAFKVFYELYAASNFANF